ncbi:MAG: hypothetical protein EAZ55_11135 [Cytophagales bacterium]|nr:MAG: hypothetical protein EAZ55_11135 [Cytophagales bacterium]
MYYKTIEECYASYQLLRKEIENGYEPLRTLQKLFDKHYHLSKVFLQYYPPPYSTADIEKLTQSTKPDSFFTLFCYAPWLRFFIPYLHNPTTQFRLCTYEVIVPEWIESEETLVCIAQKIAEKKGALSRLNSFFKNLPPRADLRFSLEQIGTFVINENTELVPADLFRARLLPNEEVLFIYADYIQHNLVYQCTTFYVL